MAPTVTWTYVVTNDGDVDLENITVTDNVLGDVCVIASLAAGAFTTCELTGTAAADQYTNTGAAGVSYTDVDGETWAQRSDSDDPATTSAPCRRWTSSRRSRMTA